MPFEQSIRWIPIAGSVQRSPGPPIFVTQHVLRRIHERLASIRPGRGVGLLAGRVETDTRSHAPFLVLDGILPLPLVDGAEDLQIALREGVNAAQGGGVEVLGWYRSHSGQDAAMRPGDVQAHDAFGDDGRVAVVVAGGGATGGVFRRAPQPDLADRAAVVL